MIEAIAGALLHYLTIICALAYLPIKFVVLSILKDQKGITKLALAAPEEGTFLIWGMILAEWTNGAGRFKAYWPKSHHINANITIVVIFFFFCCIAIHWLGMYIERESEYTRAGSAALNDRQRGQMALAFSAKPDGVSKARSRHSIGLFLVWFIQGTITFGWLCWISKIIANS